MSGRRHSVLIGFREIAGYCRNLRAGLEEAGARADFIDLFADPRGYADVPRRGAIGWVISIRARRRAAGGAISRRWWTAVDRAAMVAFFGWAMLRYDTFIFRSSATFFGLRDLRLIRMLGKQVIVVYLGTDSRPSYLNGGELAPARQPTPASLAAATGAKRRLLRQVERHATAIVAHTPAAQLHQRPFVAFLALGLPCPTAGEASAGEASAAAPAGGGLVRALHAPSDPEAKGTALIRAAVARLSEQGVAVELIEISGQPNAAVLRAIEDSDFVIDQAFSDTPMATFSAEAAARGRGSVVGGYGWDELRRGTPAEALPPAQLCHPDQLDAAIHEMVADADKRRQLGLAAQRFVRDHWSPVGVGRRFLQLIDGTAPADWMVDPRSIGSAHGAGLSRSRAADAVQGILDEVGQAGLWLDDNPAALAAVLALVEGRTGQSPMAIRRRSTT